MAETSDYGGTYEYIPIERLEYDPERDKIVIREYNPGLEGIGDPWMRERDYTPPEPQLNNPPSSWDTFTPTLSHPGFTPAAPSPVSFRAEDYGLRHPGFTPAAPSPVSSQAEDYALRHPGFSGYSLFNPSQPAWGSPTLTPSVQPLTDRSLWAGSTGIGDTMTIPTPLVYDARPPFHYTAPNIYPDWHIGPSVLNANTPIFGGLYKSDYDAWHGSADQPPELRALGWFPQFIANSVQNFSEFFNPVRGFAGVANPGPIDLERGLYSSLIDVPATTAAKIIGDIGRGKYSDLLRASKEGLESENQVLGTASRGAWEITPMGQLEMSARALWELGQYIKEGKSLPEIWDIYDEKYKALDPLTKVIVDIAIDPLNIPRFGLGAAGKLGREGMEAAKAGNAAEKAIKTVDDLHDFAEMVKYVADKLRELFGIKGGDNSQDKLPSSPDNQLPSTDQMERQYSAAGSAKGTSAFNQGVDLEDRFAPPTGAAYRRGNGDTFNVQAALNGLVQTGITPSNVTREMLYRAYIKSSSPLPFDEWLMLLASRPVYLPSVPT